MASTWKTILEIRRLLGALCLNRSELEQAFFVIKAGIGA